MNQLEIRSANYSPRRKECAEEGIGSSSPRSHFSVVSASSLACKLRVPPAGPGPGQETTSMNQLEIRPVECSPRRKEDTEEGMGCSSPCPPFSVVSISCIAGRWTDILQNHDNRCC
jgi:hypothetical protein